MKKFIYLILISLLLSNIKLVQANTNEIRDIFFPTTTSSTFKDDFGSPRGYDRTHEANDLMNDKMTPLFACIDGFINYITIPEASYGYMLVIEDYEGWTYSYVHINNDTPGTDDGNGGIKNAFAEGIDHGVKVTRGQLIGWMGDSGNAEEIASHLHFEIRNPDGTAINPYESLIKALDDNDYTVPNFSLENVINNSSTININKNIENLSDNHCESNTVFKIPNIQTLYYCGADSKRYVFPNEKIYFSWYNDFSNVKTIELSQMSNISLAGNVTYKPGIRMVKITTDPKVYLVANNGELRWVQSEEVAIKLYGDDWNKKIDDLPDAFFFDYSIGDPITIEDI